MAVSFSGFVATAGEPETSTLSVTSVERLPGTKGLLFFSGTNTVFTSHGSGTKGGVPRITTFVRQDRSSFTITTEGSPVQIVCEGDRLFMLSFIGPDINDKEFKGKSIIQEYDINTGNFIRNVSEEERKVDVIHIYNGNLYVIRKTFSPSRGNSGTALAVQTIPLNGLSEGTSYTIYICNFVEAPRPIILKVCPLGDALYCWVLPDRIPTGDIFKINLHSGNMVDRFQIPNLLDMCIIPQGPRLGFICVASREKGQYTAGILSLNSLDRNPMTADFTIEKIRLYDMLGYSSDSHAFFMRGSASPDGPSEFIRIGLGGIND
jgi:hypothetical protein